MNLTQKRKDKFKKVAFKRQQDVALVMENIIDMHNVGAVLRSCDAVGVSKIYILNTFENLKFKNYILGKRTTSGSRKWIDIEYYTDRERCFNDIAQNYNKVYATHLSTASVSIHKTDFTESCAIIFGNEKDGITQETLTFADGNINIPMMGMVQSLNISVACAVTLYELMRQRVKAGLYDFDINNPTQKQLDLYESYIGRHKSKSYNKKVDPK